MKTVTVYPQLSLSVGVDAFSDTYLLYARMEGSVVRITVKDKESNTDVCSYLVINAFNIYLLIYYSTKGDEESKDNTTLQFDLKVKCIKNKNAPKNATDPDELFINSKGMLHAVVGRMHIWSISWVVPIICKSFIAHC